MGRNFGIKATGMENINRRRTLRQQIGLVLRETGAAVAYRRKVWLGWRNR